MKLEEAWGDYMVGQKQLDGAINHFIEAGLVLSTHKTVHVFISLAATIFSWLRPLYVIRFYGLKLSLNFSSEQL